MRSSYHATVRLMALWLALSLALPIQVLAAEPSTPGAPAEQELPSGLSPEQAEMARKLLETNAEARKALETLQKQKGQQVQQMKKAAEAAEAQATKKELAPKPDAAAAAAKAELVAAEARYDWRKSTYVGSLFGKRLSDPEKEALTHFGHELFAPTPGAAQFLENIPVAPGYVVGPGDEIVVKMWGRVEGTQRMVVDRDGKIFFPKFGSLYVAGKTFDELAAFLKAKVSTIAEVRSDVSLGQLKGVRVSVVGEVRAPGWYNVSSLHTALQVLSIAGGMKDIGSMRSVRIHRAGKAISEIDLYDFLLSGDAGADIRLLQGDVIFVPVVGKLVAVAGEVRRPAIYELKGEKTLLDLVRLAGGFAPSAFKRRVQVERLEGNTSHVVLDADAGELEKGQKTFDVADGDVVRVFPIVLADENVVTLEGNVQRPGRYELKPGMTVGRLFKDEKDFLPDTHFDYALVTRLVPPDLHKEIVPVNLREIVLEKKPGADVALKPRDTLKVYPRSAFKDLPKANISGEVRMTRQELQAAPKVEAQATTGKVAAEAKADNGVLTFEIHAGARVADLVKLAGGLTRLAALDRAEIVRVDEKRDFRTIYFNLGKAMEGDPKENILLENEDHVRIHSLWETKYRKTVTASGEVNNPGDFVLTEGMRLSDLIFKAGGFRESAYAREAELIRREISEGGSLVRTETLIVSPERALSGDASYDVPLKEYDYLAVRGIPDWGEKINVVVGGEVRYPGMYAVRRGERLSSLIVRAGGFSPDAYLKASLFTRVSTQKTQQEAIDRLVEELEMAIAEKSQEIGAALDREDIESNKQLMQARHALVAQLKKAKAKGRVIIHLAEPDKLKGSGEDILLEDGDRLEVPKKMNVVNVVGRVYNPTGVVFDPANDTVGHYLKTVGGPTQNADSDHIFVVKANGSVMSRESVSGGFFAFGGGLMAAKVEPGDSVVVPEKLIQVRLMKDVKDITQILMQIAVTAGVLIALF